MIPSAPSFFCRSFRGLFSRQRMQRGEHDVLCVHFEKISQRGTILAAPETVRAERHQLARNPLRNTVRQNLHVIRCRNERTGRALQCLSDVWHLSGLRGVQHIPAHAIGCLTIECFVTGHAPNVRRYAIVLFQNRLRLEHLKHDGAAAQQLRAQLRVFLFGSPVAVQTFEDALADARLARHLGHGQRLIGDRQVIEDGFAVDVHALDAVLDDDGDLISKGRIISQQVRHWESQHMAVSILMLQALRLPASFFPPCRRSGNHGSACRPPPRSGRRCAEIRTSSNK